jgi:putative ABC transport system substrate-binding protein
LQPDIIATNATSATVALQRETRTIPIVFASVSEPVASGFVANLNQPGGNITGFALFETTLGGKWLELLSEIAPGLKRAAIMFNPDTAPVSTYMPSFEMAARSLKVMLITAPAHNDLEIETAIISLGREPGGGLVVMPDPFMAAHRAPILLAAARNNVPAVYAVSLFPRDGGLLSYAPNLDNYRRAASYVDRILRGAKPGDLPVQFPTKYEMVVNLKTAKATYGAAINSAERRRGNSMKRRQFIAGLGSAAAWPLAARAQQPGNPPTVGFLGVDPSVFRPWTAAFVARLRGLGWIEGRTVTIEYRWSEGRRFQGEAALLKDLCQRLAAQGITARAAIADTPGCAWAVARFGGTAIVSPGRASEAIASFPVAALRLSDKVISSLHDVGIERVAQIASKPRAGLRLRFGGDVLLRFDQALGSAQEALTH